MVIDIETARCLAECLVNSWNERQMDKVLAMLSDDITMTSPLFIQLLGIPDATVRGKASLAPYFEMVARDLPHMKFKLMDVYTGVDGMAMTCETIFEKTGLEVLTLDKDHKITHWVVYYDSLDLP